MGKSMPTMPDPCAAYIHNAAQRHNADQSAWSYRVPVVKLKRCEGCGSRVKKNGSCAHCGGSE